MGGDSFDSYSLVVRQHPDDHVRDTVLGLRREREREGGEGGK